MASPAKVPATVRGKFKYTPAKKVLPGDILKLSDGSTVVVERTASNKVTIEYEVDASVMIFRDKKGMAGHSILNATDEIEVLVREKPLGQRIKEWFGLGDKAALGQPVLIEAGDKSSSSKK